MWGIFKQAFDELMYYFEIELLLRERMGRDLGNLVLSFIKLDPVPWEWPISLPLSPWDPVISVDPDDGIGLPIFAP